MGRQGVNRYQRHRHTKRKDIRAEMRAASSASYSAGHITGFVRVTLFSPNLSWPWRPVLLSVKSSDLCRWPEGPGCTTNLGGPDSDGAPNGVGSSAENSRWHGSRS